MTSENCNPRILRRSSSAAKSGQSSVDTVTNQRSPVLGGSGRAGQRQLPLATTGHCRTITAVRPASMSDWFGAGTSVQPAAPKRTSTASCGRYAHLRTLPALKCSREHPGWPSSRWETIMGTSDNATPTRTPHDDVAQRRARRAARRCRAAPGLFQSGAQAAESLGLKNTILKVERYPIRTSTAHSRPPRSKTSTRSLWFLLP